MIYAPQRQPYGSLCERSRCHHQRRSWAYEDDLTAELVAEVAGQAPSESPEAIEHLSGVSDEA